jgi:hypothetical protein
MDKPKYFLEQYNDYYPLGGRGDFSPLFESIDEVKKYAEQFNFAWQCIVKIEHNILIPILWYRLGNGWIDESLI